MAGPIIWAWLGAARRRGGRGGGLSLEIVTRFLEKISVMGSAALVEKRLAAAAGRRQVVEEIHRIFLVGLRGIFVSDNRDLIAHAAKDGKPLHFGGISHGAPLRLKARLSSHDGIIPRTVTQIVEVEP